MYISKLTNINKNSAQYEVFRNGLIIVIIIVEVAMKLIHRQANLIERIFLWHFI